MKKKFFVKVTTANLFFTITSKYREKFHMEKQNNATLSK